MPHEFNNRITLERLREVLHYDPATGIFTWTDAVRPKNRGKRAGCVGGMAGYTVIRIDGELFRASRLAWFYCTGEWPTYLIDHIDGCRSNDAFANLREATSQENNSNKCALSAVSGFKGVYLNRRGTYTARLMKSRRSIHLGTFVNPADAAVAYNRGAILHFGEFARLNQL